MNIAVVIPCYNEEQTIAAVVEDYKQYFDTIYVIDNNSTDKTAEYATTAGAIVIKQVLQGKGATIRYAFNSIDSDIIVLTDGDSTYLARDSKVLTDYLIKHNLDMIVGNRLASGYFKEHQKIHGFGNKLFCKMASNMLKVPIKDLLSGSRVLSKTFYKNIDIIYNGFEIETELTKKCVQGNYKLDYLDIDYLERPENSKSSLHTFRDGFKILKALLKK